MKTIEIAGRVFDLVKYEEERFGPLNTQPEGFFEQLKGKPLEEQVAYYRYSSSYERTRVYAGGEETGTGPHKYGGNIAECNSVTGLIIKEDENLVVGVMLGESDYMLAGRCYSWETEDNNGAGYKTYSESESLTCIMVEK